MIQKVFWKNIWGLPVYIVNEETVEDVENTFIGGGHHYVKYQDGSREVDYGDFIPEPEIWVNKPDFALFIHEWIERALMKHFKMGYDEAHFIAGRIEAAWREKYQANS